MKNDLIWCISLIVISIVSLIISISNIVGTDLPKVAMHILGVVDIIAAAVFIFTTVKKVRK